MDKSDASADKGIFSNKKSSIIELYNWMILTNKKKISSENSELLSVDIPDTEIIKCMTNLLLDLTVNTNYIKKEERINVEDIEFETGFCNMCGSTYIVRSVTNKDEIKYGSFDNAFKSITFDGKICKC